jgi:ATPase family protein associated with various cellular activities (AAA)
MTSAGWRTSGSSRSGSPARPCAARRADTRPDDPCWIRNRSTAAGGLCSRSEPESRDPRYVRGVGSIAETAGHVAAERGWLVASPDGSHAAVVEPGRIVIVELRRGAQVAEIGAAAALEQTDVAWIGPAARLLVLSRRGTHSTVHLVDTDGPRLRVEIQIEGTMRIGAAIGAQALVIGTTSMAVLTAGEAHLTPYQFPGRSLPSAAGIAGQQLIVAVSGAIEEWDLLQRTPRKRLRLPRQAAIVQLGGSDRLVWMTTQQDPARIDVIPQINRGQPRSHELPEPIAHVASHPQHDVVACIGRDTGRLYLVDLDGKTALRTVDVPGLDRVDSAALFAGAAPGILAARAGQPLAVLGLDGRPPVVAPAASRAAWTAPEPARAAASPGARGGASGGRGEDGEDGDEGDEGDAAARRSSLYDLPLAPLAGRPGLVGRRLDDPAAVPATLAAGADAPPAATSNGGPAPRSGLASLQLRGVARPQPAPRKPDLGPDLEPVAPARPEGAPRAQPAPGRPRPRELADAAPPPPIIRPPIAQAIATLGPRTVPSRCSPGQYQSLLEHYRRFAAATALRAIAQDWDSGRLAFSTHDRPPFEAEVLGIVGRRSGLAPARIVEAAEALDEATTALQAARAQLAGRLSPLDVICSEHGVGTTGEIVLLFIAAPSLWGELARLYGILSNDSGRATCDEHLLWQLLGHSLDRRDIARAIDRDGPLVHHGLIRVNDRHRPFQSLSADPIVVKLVSGSAVDDDFEHGVARVPAPVSLDRLMIPSPVIDRALADLAASPAGLGRVVVTGRSGSGRRTLLAALAELAGRTLATIDAAMLIREKRVPDLAGMLQHADLRGWLPCVDGLDTIPSDDAATRGQVRELLRDHVGPLAVRLARHVPPPLVPGHVLIELPTSTIAERAAQWTDILRGAGMVVGDVDELSARFTVGPGTIKSVVASVARGAPPNPDQAIETALRQYLESKLGTVATRVTRLATWSQIVLPADIQDSIVELVARIRHRRTVYDTWGFDQVMSTSRGLTALFQGGPGTGKTLVASAIANELGLDLYRIDLSRVMSKWIGETEQNLAKVFDAAEEGQALILFDEADSLFGKRTEVRTSVDRYANLETNYLLQRLDSFEGVAVLTTNFGTAIDAAFKRRLSCRLTFPFPDDEARERLWRVHLPDQLPLAGKLDLPDLARRYKMSGGYIRNAALRAAFLAAEEQVPLSQDHLERAVRAEFREGGKLAESGFLE